MTDSAGTFGHRHPEGSQGTLMSFLECHQGLFCSFQATGNFDITMYQDLTIGIQFGSKYISDDYPPIKDGKPF